MEQGPVTSGESTRNKRAIPTLAIIQGVAAIGGMMIKGINVLVDAKRASSFNNTIKLVNENVQITHDRLITLENRTAMMAKAIIPVFKDFKQQINNTNDRLTRQYRMMATLSPSPLAYEKLIHPTEMPCITTCTEMPIDDTNKSTPDDKYPWLDPGML